MKVAKLIEVSLLVRVIVDADATEDQIIAATYPKLQDKLDNLEVGENIVSIEDDKEVPYDAIDAANINDCLNCGAPNISTPKNTSTDDLGLHCECSNCGATFDI